MSAGRPSEGAGCVNWWGFSPARDLICAGPVHHKGEVNILLVGSGDPRHLLKTLANLRDEDVLNVWLFENSMEVVARQMLLLYIALTPQQAMGLHAKTETFLEVFGNSLLRSQTDETVKRVASQLLLHVSDVPDSDGNPCLNASLFKFKERDELARIFKSWTQPCSSPAGPVSIAKAWDYRVRQHLGTRYDSKKGCFDWDLTMKLHEKGCSVINKQEYVRWRESGLAFELREGFYEMTNPSLLSSRVFSQRGDRVALRGYWGDIVSSPYLAFGVETENESLLKTQNGQHVKSLSRRRELPSTPQFDAEEENPPANIEHNCVPVSDLMRLNGVSVNFLPLDSLQKLPEKQKYANFFDIIYFSASCAHHLGPKIRQIAAPDAVLVVELAKFILDLNKEQEAGFAERVTGLCAEAGFQPCLGTKSDGVHALFEPHEDK
ncbi:dynein axonemal assembly factor 3-like isoform X2 [Syngnathoides biaculeatus]|uniref:dynein axonemal assembly factor 3-like isoform X2 n=1 Tax=Syngnathoides biaculeatus TaxID=300417 RepID=UPI002ADE41D6|nr:dynein axonemal assembly factor 3-like isoform X2 [Syngnathoides biaculeatus]